MQITANFSPLTKKIIPMLVTSALLTVNPIEAQRKTFHYRERELPALCIRMNVYIIITIINKINYSNAVDNNKLFNVIN